MKKIFLDTSVLIAQLISTERWHKPVVKVLTDLYRQRALFFVSDYVLDELYTRLNYDHGHRVLQRVNKAVSTLICEQEIRLIQVDRRIFLESERLLLRYKNLVLSFTDATTLVLMREFKLDAVLTLDGDFKKARASVVPLEE